MSDIEMSVTDVDVSLKDIEQAAQMVAEGPADTQFNLNVFTNDPTNPIAIKQLEMLYRAVLSSRVGLMHAKNTVTGKVETILVGLEKDPVEGLLTYPIARLLTEEDQNVYQPPDGHGNYISFNEPTAN